MILDEPTSNLDVRHQVYVTQMLKAVAEATGKLIIMICHDLNIAAKYSDKLIVMAPPGVIRGIGTPEEMISADTIREVYGIDCEVVQFDGAPQVLLKSEFPDRGVFRTGTVHRLPILGHV
jgi:iron complex transport system ATP-binding protein